MTKANNGKGNNINRDEWETPQELWDTLNKQYRFSFDCCSNNSNKKTLRYSNNFEFIKKYNIIENGLICWMNPPFSKAYKMFKHFFKVVNQGVAIYRIDNIETKLWYIILKKADWIHIFSSRINYEGHKGKGARFGSALIGVGVKKPININGITLKEFK